MPGVGGEKGLMPTSPHLFMSMLAGPTEQNLPPTRFRHLSLSIAFEHTKNHAFGQRMPEVGGEKRLMPLVPISPHLSMSMLAWPTEQKGREHLS